MGYDNDPRIEPKALDYLVQQKGVPETLALRFLKRYPNCKNWWGTIDWDGEKHRLRFKGIRFDLPSPSKK